MNATLLARAAQKTIGSLARDGKTDISAAFAREVRIRTANITASTGLLYALKCTSDVSASEASASKQHIRYQTISRGVHRSYWVLTHRSSPNYRNNGALSVTGY